MDSLLLQAIKYLKQGEIVAAPTDTVYGLFGDATNDDAIQKIYRVKGRPSYNPLIVHVNGIDMAKTIGQFDNESESIANYFWNIVKKPLTIVLKLTNNNISKYVTSGLKTVALRCPYHKIAIDLISEFNGPLAAPSANTSNKLSPTSYSMVKNDIGHKIPLILDGGECNIGIESTIIDLTRRPYVILRPGGVSNEDIEAFLNTNIVFNTTNNNYNTVIAPGMLKKHYSPNLPLRINATAPHDGEAFIAFGITNNKYDANLSAIGDLYEAAKNLFSTLSKLDNPNKYNGIAIMPIPNTGIGIGINDRIKRASYKQK
ncbi:MAG: threonylcarbamoyl-AMP synthase [Alphaproteobacteria bacterium]|nr:threonylcarbamoyl-AMP synthase [Alphaproteobacteria bacterium]